MGYIFMRYMYLDLLTIIVNELELHGNVANYIEIYTSESHNFVGSITGVYSLERHCVVTSQFDY